MTFAYVALDPSGKRKSGQIDAANKESAMEIIQAEGRFVLEIGQDTDQKSRTSTPSSGKKASRNDLALFTRRLADLSGAGLPLDRVLQVIADQAESPAIGEVCQQALIEVRGGKPVSDALAMHPRMFNDIFTQTLRAGEASGQFSEVATRLAEFQERETARRSQITSALIYPAVLLVFAIFVIIFLLTFVVPKLAGVFNSIGSELPISTRILMSMTGLLTTKGLYLAIGIAIFAFILARFLRTEAGGIAKDRLILRLPLVGPIVRKATVSRYARVLGTLVFGGVQILEALRLASLAAGNREFRKSGSKVEDEVREGKPIALSMKDAGAFPPVLTNMVAVGEETGNLPLMLNRVSDSLDFEVDNGMRRLVALVEPAIVVFMGVVVGFVVLSVLLPIYQAQDVVK